MVKAFPIGGGQWCIRGDTFHMKEKIKAVGGMWDGKSWKCGEAALSIPGVVRMRFVMQGPYCHMPQQRVWASQSEVDNNKTRPSFCPMCDSHYSGTADILEVFPDPE